ncbi:MAG TPA: hypothetical protein VHL50_02455, partial [Pyrinomonadaceae bacterium]|nr:hypothetical protein [Pyrinomonadaceae bacterium]
HAATHDDHDDEEEHHAIPADFKPHESPISMTLPLIVLAVLSTFGGLVGIPYAMSSLFGAGDVNVFEHTLEPIIWKAEHNAPHVVPSMVAPGQHGETAAVEHGAVTNEHTTAAESTAGAEHAVEHSAEELRTERLLAVLSVALALVGIGIGFAVFKANPLRKMPKILEQKWRIDELYNGYIVDPITNLSRNVLWKGFDLGFIDGIVNGAGYFVMAVGDAVRRVQVGFVRSYAAVILAGALVIIGYFIYYGLKLVS